MLQMLLRQALLPQEAQHVYDRLLDRTQHDLCAAANAELMAEDPASYAELAGAFSSDGEAVRRELYKALPRVAAIAVMVVLAYAASRIYASNTVFRTLFVLDDLRPLLRGEDGLQGPLLQLSGSVAPAVAAAVVVKKLRATGDLDGLMLSKTPREADLRALIRLIVDRMFSMEGGENLDLPHHHYCCWPTH